IERTDISRAEPAIPIEGALIQLRVGIADEEIRPATEDLSLHPGRYGFALCVAEPDLDARDRTAIRSNALVERILEGRARDRGMLRRAVATHEADPHGLALLAESARHGCTAGRDVTDMLDMLGPEFRMVDETIEKEGRGRAEIEIGLDQRVQHGF